MRRGGGTGRGRAAVVAVAVALLLLPAAVPAHGGDAGAQAVSAEALGLRATAGYGGRVVAGQWLPVEILFDPPRAVRGTLTVRVSGGAGPLASTREVEVAAGSPKAYRFLLPYGQPVASFTEEGQEAVEVRVPLNPERNTYLVGVLGPLPADPPALRAEMPGMAGAWAPVDAAWLEISAAALAPLGTLVAPRDALDALSPAAAANVAAGVAAGADLVVVGGGGPVAGLPVPDLADASAAWLLRAGDIDPASGEEIVAAAAPFGAGRLVAATVEPGAPGLGRSSALWSQLAQPGGAPILSGSGYSVEQLRFLVGRLLTRSATGGVPALPWLAAFIVVYVVVAGPLNALILGRLRRRELAWATIPLVTLLFTVSAFASVSGARPKVGLAGTAVSWLDGAATEWAVVGARAPQEGGHEILLPGQDWLVQSLGQSGGVTTVEQTGAGTRVRFQLAALQLGGALATRTTGAPAPLRVEARAEDDRLLVSVTNVTSRPMAGVRIRAAGTSRRIGALDAGEERAIELTGTRLPALPPWRDPFEGLPSGPPDTLEALLRTGPLDGGPGVVWAVAQLDEGIAGTLVDGDTPEDQGGIVAVGVRPRTAPGTLSPFATRRDLIAPVSVNRPSPDAVEGAAEAFLRLRLPPGTPPGRLVSSLDRSGFDQGFATDVWVWDHGSRQWMSHAEAFPDGFGATGRLVSPLGELWVRLSGPGGILEFSGRSVSGPEATA